jgi:hypothetical protein
MLPAGRHLLRQRMLPNRQLSAWERVLRRWSTGLQWPVLCERFVRRKWQLLCAAKQNVRDRLLRSVQHLLQRRLLPRGPDMCQRRVHRRNLPSRPDTMPGPELLLSEWSDLLWWRIVL